MKAEDVIRLLLDVLPDSGRAEDWYWCWDELLRKSQDDVKRARKAAEEWLAANPTHYPLLGRNGEPVNVCACGNPKCKMMAVDG